jgi:ribosomal protein S18 acetylase RimI-like enzyme
MLRLRRIEGNDWEQFRSVRLASLREAPEAFSSTYADWSTADESRWRARLENVPFTIIAELDGQIAGTVSATAVNAAGVVALVSMWVAPQSRGKGVGDALIESVVAWANGQTAQAIELDVRESNVAAIALYERHGFVDCGRNSDDPPERRMIRR